MEIDHLFIFSDSDGQEAEQLLEFGLLEGSNRVQVGCRKLSTKKN